MELLDRLAVWGGVLSCLVGMVLFLLRVEFVLSGERAEGEVVGHAEHEDVGGLDGEIQIFSLLYAAKIRFRDGRGRRIDFESGLQTRPARRHVGDKVQVIYAAGNPERACIAEPLELWALPAFLFVFGAYFVWPTIMTAIG